MSNDQDVLCKVRDLCAITEPRTHEFPEASGRLAKFTFPPGEHIPMPLEHAMKLVANDGFEVLDPNGKRLELKPATGNRAVGGGIALRPDEVVARLEELTVDALLARANARPGGEKLRRQDGRDKIIAFLVGAGGEAGENLDAAPEGARLGGLVHQD